EVYARQLDVAPGFPGNELSAAEHEARFEDCLRYAAYPLPGAQVGAFLDAVDTLETVPDARALVDCLIAESVPERSASAERITAAVARSTR
ncbi:MAG TPA: hypothetical protein VE907_13565, partial [Gammaproteobacteria bacterium]|nr:hypothetical protein [Gammaproteobacteria bacterium]